MVTHISENKIVGFITRLMMIEEWLMRKSFIHDLIA